MKATETSFAIQAQYAHVLDDLHRELSGFRASMQAYECGAIGFGVWRKAGAGSGEEGWAVIVADPQRARSADTLKALVRRNMLSAVQSGDLIHAGEFATPKARVVFAAYH